MCSPTAAAIGGAAIGGASAYSSAKDQAKQIGDQIAAQNASKVNIVKSMNYDIANLSQEQRDQYDQAIAQLQSNSINALRNQGMIQAAISDTGLEGRSFNHVMREVEGQDARVRDGIRGSFKDSFAGLQQQKEMAVLNADAQVKGMPKITGPSSTSVMLGIASAAIGGASTGVSVYSRGVSSGLWGTKTGSNTGSSSGTGSNTR